MSDPDFEIRLDREGEPWIGRFPGLGTVAVDQDGAVDVTPVVATEDADLRAQALRYGWGEALSWVRRGYSLAFGAAVCAPNAQRSVLLIGHPHDAAIVMAELVRRRWLVMSDLYTPVTRVDGVLVARPREAPILLAKRRMMKEDLDGQRVRDDSDARSVGWPRYRGDLPVAAVVSVGLRRPHEEPLLELTGQRRFEAAAGLLVGGVLTPNLEEDSVDDMFAEHLRLATLLFCRLRIDAATVGEDVEELMEWLAQPGSQ